MCIRDRVYTYSKNDLIMFDKYAAWYYEDSKIDTYRETLSPYFEDVYKRQMYH